MRIDLVNVLITGAGAPGTIGTLYSLKKTGRKIRTVGVDVRSDVYGKYLCDKFYQVPKPEDIEFVLKIAEICRKEKIDVVLPQVNEELFKLAVSRDAILKFESAKIAISHYSVIALANNKQSLLETSNEIGIPTPKYYLAKTFTELEKSIYKLGYPEKKVVIKPPISRGMMGLRIVDDSIDRKNGFYNRKPEDCVSIKKEELTFLGEEFPTLMVMEYLSGKEYSVDVLSKKNDVVAVVPRTRDLMRTGITFIGTVENNKEIISYSRKLSEKLGLEYAHGYQFKLDDEGIPKIIECNPRIQGTMVLSTFAGANIIYGALKMALDEKLPKFNVKWGTRLLRDWGAISVFNNEKIGSSNKKRGN